MNGGEPGTGGGKSGTSGAAGFWPVFGFILVVTLVVIAINITSTLIEHPPGAHSYALWEPFCWEITSAVGIFVLCPVIFRLFHRFPRQRLGLVRFLGLQAGIAILYSMAHVAIMVALRKATYAVLGHHYAFSLGNLPLQLLYEGRKDLLTYAINVGVFWVADRLGTKPMGPKTPQKLEIKADGRTLYLEPGEIMWIEAAGNYVEVNITTRAQPILVRGTLGDYEGRLADDGFIRVHRSRLLNRAHIRGFEATHSGDVTITLSDGRDIAGSRRFRENLQ